MIERGGSTVVEAVVALLLGTFLLQLGWASADRLGRHGGALRDRQDALLATRIARTVLRAELARAAVGDWSVGGDSLRLRAVRGSGPVCSVGGSEVVVAWTGDRRPEPAKDSVELTLSSGARIVRALSSDRPWTTGCPIATGPDEELRAWSLTDGAVPEDAVFARVFEPGAYHLVGSALRYRVGAGGRQPLTPEVWRDDLSGLPLRPGSVRLRLALRTGTRESNEFLAWVER